MNTQELAQGAHRLLNDAAAQEALAMMDATYLTRWAQAQTTESREMLWYARKAVADFQKQLQVLADRGTVETMLEERASARKA